MKDELITELIKFLNTNTFFDHEINSSSWGIKLEKKNYDLEISRLKKLFAHAYLILDCNEFSEILTKVHFLVHNVVNEITKSRLEEDNNDNLSPKDAIYVTEDEFDPNQYIHREDFMIGLLRLLSEFEELNCKSYEYQNIIESNISLKQQILLFQVLGVLDILKDIEATKKAKILSFLTGKSEDNIRQTFSNYYNKEHKLCPFKNPDDLKVVIELLESLQLNDFTTKAKQLSL